MIALLLATALGSTPDPVVHTARWQPVPDRVDDRGTLAGGREVRLVWLPGGALLRGQCKTAPYRRALTASGIVEGPYSWPVAEESGWVFPPGPPGVREWLVEPMDCPLYVLESSLTSAGLARMEHTAYDLPASVAWVAPFDEDADAWLDGGDPDTWRARYATLRPPGPHPTFSVRPRPEKGARKVQLDPFDRNETDQWWRVDDARWEVRGPRRVRVVARWRGTPRLLCLQVDDQTSCLDRALWEETVLLDGALEARSGHVGGEVVSRPAAWSVLLPPGRHALALPGPALLRTWAQPCHLYDGPFEEPDAPLVFPATPPGPDARNSVAPDGVRAQMLLYGPSIAPVLPDEVRWVPTGSGGVRYDDPGETVVLVAAPDVRDDCTLSFGDADRWTIQDPVGVWRFVWSGRSDAVAAPVGEGCVARVRVTGLEGEVPGAWVAGRWWIGPAGAVITFDVRGTDPVLWVSHPEGQTEPYRVRVEHADGTTSALVVEPRPAAAERWSPGGEGWHAPLAVPLPTSGRIQVSADVTLALKVTAGTPETPDPSATLQGKPGDLRTLSGAIASASDDHARAAALLSRAGSLWAQGALGPAWQDWERAAALIPAAVDDNPITLPLRRSAAALAHGPDHWVPVDPRWVPASAPELKAAAARGDHLSVAVGLRARGQDPRRWWREALAGGQVATASQRMEAYRDLVALSPQGEPDEAWWWPVRAGSRWERVYQVSGVRSDRRDWPEPPQEVDLFPDDWPRDEITAVGHGWEVQLPAGPAQDVAVRCRGTRVAAEADGCRFRALDLDGRTLATADVDPWGTPGTLHVPASDHAVHLTVRPDEGVRAQARVPPRTAVSREALALPAGGTARFTVLGPTVVRVEALTRTQGTVRVSGTPFPVDGTADLQVPVDAEGPVTIAVTSDVPMHVVPWVRVPAPGSGPVPSDLLHPAATAEPGEGVTWKPAPRPPWVPPTGRPPQERPLTVISRTALGNADVLDEQPEDETGLGLRVIQDVEVTGRLQAPVWMASHVRAEGAPGGGMLSWGLMGEAVPIHARWRLRLLASGEYVSSVGADWSFSSLQLSMRATADAPLAGMWRGLLHLGGVVRTPLVGEFSSEAWNPDLTRLWSPYKEDHRSAWIPGVELRVEPGPWAQGAWSLEAVTNDNPIDGLDHFATDLHIDLARPSLWLRAGGRFDLRLPDSDRSVAYLSPEVYGTAAVTAWPERDLGVQVRLSGRYRSYHQEATGLVEVRLYASADRGLADVRPSSIAMRHAHEWEQDRAAERRRRREDL